MSALPKIIGITGSGGVPKVKLRTCAKSTPVFNASDSNLATNCDRLQGGAKKPGAPQFSVVVDQEPDLIWRDDDLVLVQEENNDIIVVDNI